jgi:hypothetical protein
MATKKKTTTKARKSTRMHWNYRVVSDATGWLAIHEVFYRGGKPISMTENPVDVSSETKAGIVRVLRMMLRDATRKPVLKQEDF